MSHQTAWEKKLEIFAKDLVVYWEYYKPESVTAEKPIVLQGPALVAVHDFIATLLAEEYINGKRDGITQEAEYTEKYIQEDRKQERTRIVKILEDKRPKKTRYPNNQYLEDTAIVKDNLIDEVLVAINEQSNGKSI